MPTLPVEIWDRIVACIDASDGKDHVALPSSHIVTRSLFSCLTVCKTISFAAQEQVYRKCLYIDSAWQLKALVKSYRLVDNRASGAYSIQQHTKRQLSASAYLAPFSEDTVDEPDVIADMESLFSLLSQDLKRLVINMPLRSVYPDDKRGPTIRPALRKAFQHLTAIEEFVSVRDELYLSTATPDNKPVEPSMWTQWQSLRRLALYNVDTNPTFIQEIRQLPMLETVILTRADSLDEEIRELLPALQETVNVILVDMEAEFCFLRTRMGESPSVTTEILRTRISGAAEERVSGSANLKIVFAQNDKSKHKIGPMDTCQSWVERKALEGLLWEC